MVDIAYKNKNKEVAAFALLALCKIEDIGQADWLFQVAQSTACFDIRLLAVEKLFSLGRDQEDPKAFTSLYKIVMEENPHESNSSDNEKIEQISLQKLDEIYKMDKEAKEGPAFKAYKTLLNISITFGISWEKNKKKEKLMRGAQQMLGMLTLYENQQEFVPIKGEIKNWENILKNWKPQKKKEIKGMGRKGQKYGAKIWEPADKACFALVFLLLTKAFFTFFGGNKKKKNMRH